ncbi:Tight junction protein ZO-3, partial [Manacus vitellinus]
WWVPTMEEMVIWEQHTVTLSKLPASSPGWGLCPGQSHSCVFLPRRKDHIVMVNGLSMENVSSSFAIQTLKTCGKIANITLKRPRKVHLPVSKSSPGSPAVPRHIDSDEDDGLHRGDPALQRSRDDLDHSRGYDGDSSSERSSGHHRDDRRQHRPVSRSRRRRPASSLKRLPRQDVPTKPITSVLVKQKQNEEYGVKLGSQLFIKHIVESGLAAKGSSLQEGDLILKINGVASQDMSLAETQQLIERTEGILTLLILRDHRQFLVNIPDVDSQSDSSRMDDISDIDSELSHPPSPDASPQSPAAARMNSPLESRRSTREPVAEVTMADARGLALLPADPLEAVEGDDHSPHTAPRAALRDGYSADSRVVRFMKAKSAGLRLAGGNDVGIFVSSVRGGSPADSQGVREGDQILQVNDTSFQHLTREEAVEHLMALPVGEEVTLWTQSKPDIYRKMISSNVGDSFYIRTHFDFEKDTPSGLSFVRGDVFHVLDTMYRGRLGNWLAVRVGRDLQEQDKGIIPNQSRAEQIASLESVLKTTSGANPSGARAEFWKLRGLRGAKKMLRKSREDLSALTKQGRYPPYERVVLKEASFKRPVVILGPIADIAMQKLSRELPELFEIAPSVPRDGASSKVIKLDSVQQIAEKGKHALLDITPSAVERLNYVQYYPVVVFCEPESRPGVKAMRQWLAPDSRKSSRRLYAQANKMKKYCSHLFTATIHLSGSGNAWFQQIQDIIRTQQSQPIWTTAEQVQGTGSLRSSEPAQLPPSHGLSSEPAQVSPSHGLSSSEPAQVSPRHGQSDKVGPPRLAQGAGGAEGIGHKPPPLLLPPRAYEHEAVRKRFTHARDDSDQDEGYEWGPATDV